MSTEPHRITVSGIAVEVVRKDIKNLHLGVYPPHGRVRVAAPMVVSDEAVRLAVIDKLGWIKRQRAGFDAQPRQSAREIVSGESHYFMGRRYLLKVVEHDDRPQVIIKGRRLILFVRHGAEADLRARVLDAWYREQLKQVAVPLIAEWCATLGVKVTAWGVKKMKTRWGTCNVDAKRIWLNLELATKSARCVEYIIAHELIHLLERTHNARFQKLLDLNFPDWRYIRRQLNSSRLGAQNWPA